jgi:hypothetical protein
MGVMLLDNEHPQFRTGTGVTGRRFGCDGEVPLAPVTAWLLIAARAVLDWHGAQDRP